MKSVTFCLIFLGAIFMTPDVTAQTISPIGTADFSFGAVVNIAEHGNDFTIDVSRLHQGLYWLYVGDQNHSKTLPFIVN